MAEIIIVGKRKGQTKNGKVFFNYYGLKPFTEYDQQNSECYGQSVVSEFSYTMFDVSVGDLVDFRYEPGFDGKATLVDIVLIRPAEEDIPFEQKPEKDKKEAGGKQ